MFSHCCFMVYLIHFMRLLHGDRRCGKYNWRSIIFNKSEIKKCLKAWAGITDWRVIKLSLRTDRWLPLKFYSQKTFVDMMILHSQNKRAYPIPVSSSRASGEHWLAPIPACVTWGRLLNLFVPQFLPQPQQDKGAAPLLVAVYPSVMTASQYQAHMLSTA